MTTITESTRSGIDLSANSASVVIIVVGLAAVAFALEGALWLADQAHCFFFGLGLKKHGLRK